VGACTGDARGSDGRTYLEESIERLNASTSSARLTKDEFLAQTELPST